MCFYVSYIGNIKVNNSKKIHIKILSIAQKCATQTFLNAHLPEQNNMDGMIS